MDLEYIRGFFGRLCSVDIPGRAIVLTTSQIDHGRHVGAALHELSITCSMNVRDGRLKLRVSGQESLTRFRDTVGFHDVSKASKLTELLNQYGGNDG